MLQNLYIKNLILIDSVELSFGNNFNVITGETGAGKSILLDCLSYCLGSKNSRIKLKNNDAKGLIIASFDISKNFEVKKILADSDFGEVDEVIVKKSITKTKSQSYLNDELVSTNLLKKIAPYILEIFSQHEASSLLDKPKHILILDNYSENEEVLQDVENSFGKYKEKKLEYENAIIQLNKIKKEKEFLEIAFDELNILEPVLDEEKTLVENRIILQKSSKIKDTIAKSNKLISDDDITGSIYSSQRILNKMFELTDSEEFLEKVKMVDSSLEKAAIELKEAIEILNEMLHSDSLDSRNLEKIEDRISDYREMGRKYQKDPNELAQYLDDITKKIDLINTSDSTIKKLEEELNESKNKFLEIANKLSDDRKQNSKTLEKNINDLFPELKMPSAKFIVEITKKSEEQYSKLGVDNIVFKALTNSGQDFNELGKVASGGELSRMMLAIKYSLVNKKSFGTIIFDEIDTGIGGATANAVGQCLSGLSKNAQVISITHQPQVASKSDSHFLVKKIDDGSVKVSVKSLTKKESSEEIARMISGEKITVEARAAAEKLKAS